MHFRYLNMALLTVLQFVAVLNHAQDRIISFRNISTNNGLINNNINCFAQDKWGYIWIGTANGLSCYDSYNFINYQAKLEERRGLVSSNIRALHCDSSNNMWIGTLSGGLSVLERQTGQMYAYHLLTHNARFSDVRAVTEFPGGGMLLGTNIGLFVAQGDISNMHFSNVNHFLDSASADPTRQINCFATDALGRIWIGTESGSLFLLRPSDNERGKYTIDDFSENQLTGGKKYLTGIQGICNTRTNEIWYATWGQGIQHFSSWGKTTDKLRKSIGKTQRLYTNDSIDIATSVIEHNGVVYISTWNHGAVVYNLATDKIEQWKNTKVRHPGLSTNDLFSVFADNAGNIWLGASRFGGISLYTWKARMVEHYELGEIVQSEQDRNRIYSINSDKLGNIFIGGVGGMFKFHNDNLKISNIIFALSKKGLSNLKILSAEYDDFRKKIWIGTDGMGLIEYDITYGTCKNYQFKEGVRNGLSNNSIHEIHMDPEGLIWIGSWGGGLDVYNPEKNTFTNFKLDEEETDKNVILDITADNIGNLWLATMGMGLMYFSKSETRMYDIIVADSLGNIPLNYYFVYHDLQENIWAACLENGLVCYNPRTKKYKWFNAGAGLSYGHISGIEPATDSLLLINTDKGVYILHLDGKIKESYRFTDNLTPMTFWNESSISDNNNWVYLASDKGMVRYNPNSLKKDSVQPYVRITSLRVNNDVIHSGDKVNDRVILDQPIESTHKIKLKYFQNSIVLEFSAMDFTNSTNNLYTYILEGFDTEWHTVPSSERKAVYTNLPAGKYRFRIKASNSDQIWSKEVQTLEIEVEAPFWHSAWFYFLISLVLLYMISLFVKMRQKNLERVNQRLVDEVEIRTQEVVLKVDELSRANRDLSKQAELLNIGNEQIRRQKELLSQQNKEINDSMTYAKGLQQALLPSPTAIRRLFPEHFVLFRPKEAISGDFYWAYGNKRFSTFIVADCTGHGIPGAMVSMLGLSFFNSVATADSVKTAGEVVEQVGKMFNKVFSVESTRIGAKDSMDLSVCVFDKELKQISFCGIFNSLYLVRDSQLHIYPADRIPLSCEHQTAIYTNHTVDYKLGDVIYMFSDGFQDQFGGAHGKKYMSKNFKQILTSIAGENMSKQKSILTENFAGWLFHKNSMGHNEQIDDVLVVGIRITGDIFETL